MRKTITSFVACLGLTIGLVGCSGDATKVDNSTDKEGDLKIEQAPGSEDKGNEEGGDEESTSTASASDADPGNGFAKVTTSDGSMTMNIPEGWQDLGSDDPTVKAALEEAKKDNPGLAGMIAQATSNDSIKLFAFDLSDGSADDGFADNVNVIVQDAPANLKDDWENQVKSGAEMSAKMLNADGGMKSGVIDLPAGKAGTYYGPMKMGGEHSNDTLSYMLLNDSKVYIITMSCGKNQLDEKREAFEKVANSIRFTS